METACFSPKRWYPPTSLHGVITQKNNIVIKAKFSLCLCTMPWRRVGVVRSGHGDEGGNLCTCLESNSVHMVRMQLLYWASSSRTIKCCNFNINPLLYMAAEDYAKYSSAVTAVGVKL
jgi:hypothetical protein